MVLGVKIENVVEWKFTL